MNRQCSIGYHEECSDPNGYECNCPCHTYQDTLENLAFNLTNLILADASPELIRDAAAHLQSTINNSPWNTEPEEDSFADGPYGDV